jgi:hypothetical protein
VRQTCSGVLAHFSFPKSCSFHTTFQEKKMMNHEFQQYRFARMEAEKITRCHLDAQFKSGVTNADEIENAIAELLAAETPTCVPWRRSEIEQTGCRDGIRLAALEFFWSRRQELRRR